MPSSFVSRMRGHLGRRFYCTARLPAASASAPPRQDCRRRVVVKRRGKPKRRHGERARVSAPTTPAVVAGPSVAGCAARGRPAGRFGHRLRPRHRTYGRCTSSRCSWPRSSSSAGQPGRQPGWGLLRASTTLCAAHRRAPACGKRSPAWRCPGWPACCWAACSTTTVACRPCSPPGSLTIGSPASTTTAPSSTTCTTR